MKHGWRIVNVKGSYYAGPSGIGPRFGASREGAMVFDSAVDAVGHMGHWAFATCELKLPDGRLRSAVPNAGKEGAQ